MTSYPREDAGRAALFTDLYQLTMAQAYNAERMEAPAAFELFFRKMPEARNYVVAAGLEDVLSYLESFQFSESDLAYLREQGQFSESFLARLSRLRFTGDVDAVAEGTVVFPPEPLLRVVAPVIEAQLVETMILNQLHFQSIAATKASRVVVAAQGRNVVDFGSRRAHGTDAGMSVARTSYLAGATGTSNVLAGKLHGIPIFGTMAHSYIQAHDDEAAALEAFAREFPGTTLLVDTYDTLEGVRKVIELCRRPDSALSVQAVRLDSGDLAELAKGTRRLLDGAGLNQVRIFASGGLDEYALRDLLAAGAPIDGFGVGTNMAVSNDAPSLDMAYKLVEYDGRPRMKLSSGKELYPGRKQVFRTEQDGLMAGDVLGCHDEELPGRPLLRPVMRTGKRLPAASPSLAEIRAHAAEEFGRLPASMQSIEPTRPLYKVAISAGLDSRRRNVVARLESQRPPNE